MISLRVDVASRGFHRVRASAHADGGSGSSVASFPACMLAAHVDQRPKGTPLSVSLRRSELRRCGRARRARPCNCTLAATSRHVDIRLHYDSRGRLRHREVSSCRRRTVRPVRVVIMDLHCPAHSSPSLHSHRGRQCPIARVARLCALTRGQLRYRRAHCVFKGRCDQCEPSWWTCTAPRIAHYLFLGTGDVRVPLPQWSVLLELVVPNFAIEGHLCVIKAS